ncbi:MAG: sugar phosphate nucleotidyltransferase [bacterium]|nr:sugar phosphate nucleotidyltransferase [bacterium]
MDCNIVGLVPAAGEGTRLFPFSRAVPKEIYPILGKPVIEHTVENLRAGGITKIFVIVGYQKGALMDYLGDGSIFGVDVAYLYQQERKGLGHAIFQAENWIDTTFVTLLGDSFIEPKEEINDLIRLHREEEALVSVLLFRVKDPTAYGVARLSDLDGRAGLVEELSEKPTLEEAGPFQVDDHYLALCGVYVFEPEIFSFLEKTRPDRQGELQITDAIEMAVDSGEKVFGLVLEGKYLDIGKWRTVLQTEKKIVLDSNIEDHIQDRENMCKRTNE